MSRRDEIAESLYERQYDLLGEKHRAFVDLTLLSEEMGEGQ